MADASLPIPTNDMLQVTLNLLRSSLVNQPAQHQTVMMQLNEWCTVPEFLLCLLYIFSSGHTVEPDIRALAGLLLKNNINQKAGKLSLQFLDSVRAGCTQGLADSNEAVRHSAAVLVSTVFKVVTLRGWPTLLPSLVSSLDTANVDLTEGCMRALLNICEDCANDLTDPSSGSPVDFILPKVIQMIDHDGRGIRSLALQIVNQLIIKETPTLSANLAGLLSRVYVHRSDPSPIVRKFVCQAIVLLMDVVPDLLDSSMGNIIQFMIDATNDSDPDVGLEACEFWLTVVKTPMCYQYLQPFVQTLIPILLSKMCYTQAEMMNLLQSNSNSEEADSEENNIRPRHHRTTIHGASQPTGGDSKSGQVNPLNYAEEDDEFDDDEDDDDDDDDDDEELYADWTLRKCSAAALDMIAGTFHDDILPVLIQILNSKIETGDWLQQESAILALGAVAEGCRQGMSVYLPQLIPFLISKLRDPNYLVRQITCWTLSRYSHWCIQQRMQGERMYFEQVLFGFLEKILDPSKGVQRAACSAFVTLEEVSDGNLKDYLEVIVPRLAEALSKLQIKSLLILYDAIGALSHYVGNDLSKPEYANLIAPHLILRWKTFLDRWRQPNEEYSEVFPLLECLTNFVMATNRVFLPYAGESYNLCIRMITDTLQDIRSEPYEEIRAQKKELVVVALDVLSSLASGLGPSVESFVAKNISELVILLDACLQDSSPEVRQSAMAVIGDFAISCFVHLKAFVPQIMPKMIANMSSLDSSQLSVYNNAAWAIGEIAIKYGTAMQPYLGHIMDPLLKMLEFVTTNAQYAKVPLLGTLAENVAITLGRLGLACGVDMAPRLSVFIRNWCEILKTVRDLNERWSAYQGLCELVRLNPHAVFQVNAFVDFCECLIAWESPPPPEDLEARFGQILRSFKEAFGNNWTEFFENFPPHLKLKLQTRFAL